MISKTELNAFSDTFQIFFYIFSSLIVMTFKCLPLFNKPADNPYFSFTRTFVSLFSIIMHNSYLEESTIEKPYIGPSLLQHWYKVYEAFPLHVSLFSFKRLSHIILHFNQLAIPVDFVYVPEAWSLPRYWCLILIQFPVVGYKVLYVFTISVMQWWY